MEDAVATGSDRTREAWPVVWFEVLGGDAERLRDFYSRLLDQGDAGRRGGVAGRVGRASPGQPSCVTIYTRVPDLEAAIQTARELGGRLLVRPRRTPDGRVAVVTDPAGNPVGLIAA